MGLKIETQERTEKKVVSDLDAGTIALLEANYLVIATDPHSLDYSGVHEFDQANVVAINLENGNPVINSHLKVKQIFKEGEKVTFEVNDS